MRELPSGTVTFLFTDIEGSTRLLHELGDRYADVLAEHRRVLRDAFARHSGVEVDTQGDAFFVAFARAKDALAAAVEAQTALEKGPVRVRMGLHAGEPLVTDDGYVGMDIHTGARIAAAGHGGQVLLSQTTRQLVDADVQDLGAHRLKDVAEPLRLYQVRDGSFPPLKTLNNSNLPVPATPLVGRKKELVDLLRLVARERCRVVTVVGPGGIGKTRLALEVAAEAVESFADGVWFVDLSPLRDPALVVPTIAAALEARASLTDHFADKELLLALDNFEQVADAAASLAGILASCPNLQLLVTSREPLHIAGEREYPLRPIAEAPAVELFRERASAVYPDFDAGYEQLVAICRRLDGLPLAIELAAARVKALDVETLASRLEQRLPLLTSRSRDVPERQRTLRAAIEWSYELLAGDERELFGRLSVFAAGWTLEAAQEVCDADIDPLESLVDKSLVRLEGERYSMLETIREFAAERLQADPAADELRARHADYFRALAERAEPKLGQREQASWQRVLDDETDNLRACLRWAIEGGRKELALVVAGALGAYWSQAERYVEGHRWLEEALAMTGTVPPAVEANALARAARLAFMRNEFDRAETHARAACELYRAAGDRVGVATCLNILGNVVDERGLPSPPFHEEALELFRDAGDERGVRLSLHLLGERAAASGDPRGIAWLEESIERSRTVGDVVMASNTLHSLADALLRRGDGDAAEARYHETLSLAQRAGRARLSACCLAGIACVAASRGRDERAARLWGAVEAVERQLGMRLLASERGFYERALASALERNRAAVDVGRTLTLDEAVEYALSIDSP